MWQGELFSSCALQRSSPGQDHGGLALVSARSRSALSNSKRCFTLLSPLPCHLFHIPTPLDYSVLYKHWTRCVETGY